MKSDVTLDLWSNDHICSDQDDNNDDEYDQDDHNDHDEHDDDGDGDKYKASANIGLASARERPLQQIPAVANFENTILLANFITQLVLNFWPILTNNQIYSNNKLISWMWMMMVEKVRK